MKPIALALNALTIALSAGSAVAVEISGGKLLLDARWRLESVADDAFARYAFADTVRIRLGYQTPVRSGWSGVIEAEATQHLFGEDFNSTANGQIQFPAVVDPDNTELNQAYVRYAPGTKTQFTLGRQRLQWDNQRFFGNVGWRQNEQTFDAARLEAKLGPIMLDGTYAISQRGIWGVDAGPRTAFEGDFVFLGAGAKLGPIQVKAFSYLLDFELKEQGGTLAAINADTQTYGLRAAASLPLAKTTKLNLAASYARQLDWKDNPVSYSADYIAAEAGLAHGNFGLTAGYERLGADGGRAFQTPMATLHKFNGWADLFLTTPANGLEDWYAGAAIKFPAVKALPGLNAAVTYHRFESDLGGLHYGNEWDASLGFKLGRVSLLAKVADYDAKGFGVDTRKLWLQLEFAY
jgi:hypothetical protein